MISTRSSSSSEPLITIVTVLKSAPGWQPECVYRMRDAVARHLSLPHRFVCITDADLDCDTLPLLPLENPKAWGIWSKIQLYRPDLGLTGPCLYIDLDMLIIDDFADIVIQCLGHQFLMSRDPWRPEVSCSALMYWEGDHSDLWDTFLSEPLEHWMQQYQDDPDRKIRGVEQAWVADHKPHELLQDVLDSTVRTDRIYKRRYKGTAAILFCSGNRKPWNPLMRHHPDVIHYWLGESMIVDTFLFNDEFDMLDIRLVLTQDWVDRWVVCEANRTMSGKHKPYHLSENIDRYLHLKDRLRVIKLDVPESWTNWDIENGQRAALLKGYSDCQADDIIMHSDLDEILDPRRVPYIMTMLEQRDRPISCVLDMYINRFDQKLDRRWKGNVVARKRMFRDPCELYKGPGSGVGHARKKKDRSLCDTFPGVAGWHWGWMGSTDVLKNKVVSCIESQNRDVEQVLASLDQYDYQSAVNHKCSTVYTPDPDYPESVLEVIKRYPWWTDPDR
jgi:hypothetical protein